MKRNILAIVFTLSLLLLMLPLHAQKGKGRMRDTSGREPGMTYPGLPFGGAPCKFKPSYSFSYNMVVKMETWGEKDDSMRMTSRYYFSDSATSFASEMIENSRREDMGSMISIVTVKDSTVLMLMDREGRKMGFCSKWGKKMWGRGDFKKEPEKKPAAKPMDGFAKTGKTKMVCGHSCEEWRKEDDKEIRSYWITQDATGVFGRMRRFTGGMGDSDSPSETPGMMLEMDNFKKDKKQNMVWQVIEMNANSPHTISTDGYEIR